ncbi:GNAT family N-acetyltransferase [Evansella tamaricis]|uniref:N-acetyltransferase n=1 Tax=Evansella tamaricis TaxID=2069301 RepID=A0ABS6JEH9_9BACI|nr:N-acetyltransferase [Evansella tamaricis]MBU9711594.1 N-acetyltransferase [Evansella tamaricis]
MGENGVVIRPEKDSDYTDIASLVMESFQKGTEYSDGTNIIAFINEIRAGRYYIPDLSFVAELDGSIVGHFLFSHFPLGRTFEAGNYDKDIVKTDIVMLAPVAVNANYFRRGIGKEMLLLGMKEVRKQGYRAVTVEGNPDFYNKVGFVTSSRYGILPSENCVFPQQHPDCMMVQEMYEGALDKITGYIDYSMYENA